MNVKRWDSHTLSELFVQKQWPIVFTMNGQNQGELGAKLIRDVGLNLVSGYIIVHVDASGVDGKIRRELFATSREGLKEGPVLASLVQVLTKMLKEDAELFVIERELTERITKRENQATSDAVKKQVTRLLLDAGLEIKEPGIVNVPAPGEAAPEPPTTPRPPGPRRMPPQPLTTLPYPEVTKLEIVAPCVALRVRQDDLETVRVQTDADDRFDREGRLAIRSKPDMLEIASKAKLRGGRIMWRLRTKKAAPVGSKGEIIVSLTKPDGDQLTARIPYEILPPLMDNTKAEKGFIPPFEVIPINPDDRREEWDSCNWPDPDGATPAQLSEVAYKAVKLKDGINVYPSVS